MDKREIIDVHCHLFNAQYAIMELTAATWNNLWGNYPHQKGAAKKRAARGIVQALQGIEDFAEWIARLIEAALSSCEGNYTTAQEKFAESPLGIDSLLIMTPLMMDIYFTLDDNADEEELRRGGQRSAPIIGEFDVPDDQKKRFDTHFADIKSLIIQKMQKLPVTKRRSASDQNVDDIFEDVRQELLSITKKLRRVGDNYEGIELSPGYKKHMHDLEYLCAKYPDKVFPFLAVDPRRIGIMKLIEMKVNKGNGLFKGIKLYPPLGYLPTHPNLMPVFEYCSEHDIPITLHCSDGGLQNFRKENYVTSWEGNNHLEEFKDTKGNKSLYYTAPDKWLPVLAKWKDLRINFAHFGGGDNFDSGDTGWADAITNMIKDHPNVYADISYFTKPGLPDKISQLAANNENLKTKLMFGTDYIMIMLEKKLGGLGAYFDRFSGLDNNLLSYNAKNFLKIANTPGNVRFDHDKNKVQPQTAPTGNQADVPASSGGQAIGSVQSGSGAIGAMSSGAPVNVQQHPLPALPTADARIKILFFAANLPADPLALDEEARQIQQKIRSSEYRNIVEFIPCGAVRPGDLLDMLNQHRPHIVHFSGHGSNCEELYLLDNDHKAKPVSKEAIERLFATMQDQIRLVVLNACYSQPQAAAITRHVDCAIGMSRSIGDFAAVTFSAQLYSAIAYGKSIRNAFDQAMVELMLHGIPENNTPNLLVRPGVDADQVCLVDSAVALTTERAKQQEQTITQAFLHQLRPPTESFVGRDKELDDILKSVAKGGATITGLRGMGGIGKTELALFAADMLKENHPDAWIMLELRGASPAPVGPEQALAQVIHAFHPEARLPDGLAELQSVYQSVLQGKRALILADNAAGAEQVRPLIPPAGCCLLITSRFRFALKGWQTVDLSVLPEKKAQKLLRKLAPRLNVKEAAALAQACGCLPLALSLAGGTLQCRSEITVQAYLTRLAQAGVRLKQLDKYKHLTAEELGIEASLTLSYDLLSSDLQEFWQALFVFPGSFDAAAAGAVNGTQVDIAVEGLGDLWICSLVEREAASEGRYRLHDLARDFAGGKLTAEERNVVCRRHAMHFVGILRQADEFYLKGGEQVKTALALFDRERANIETGQAWAAATAQVDDEAARLCSEYPDVGAYCLALRQHPRREQIPWLEAAMKAARKLKDRGKEGAHMGNLGGAYYSLGEVRRAIRYHEQALVIDREIGYRSGEGNALGNLGNAYANLGEMRKAIEYHKQALVIDREIGDRRGEGTDLGNLGSAYYSLGEVRKAIGYYEQALAIACDIGDRHSEGYALGNLGNAYSDLQERDKATIFYQQALAIAQEIGDRRGEGERLWNWADELERLGRRTEAIPLAQAALAIFEEIEDPNSEMVRNWLEAQTKGRAKK